MIFLCLFISAGDLQDLSFGRNANPKLSVVLGDGGVTHSRLPLSRRLPVPLGLLPKLDTAFPDGPLHLPAVTWSGKLLSQGTGK